MNTKWMAGACLIGAMTFAGCNRDAEVVDDIEKSLDEAKIEDVSVDEDRDKGVVRLSGSVQSEADKERAEAIAKAAAPRDVIANEIRVLPAGMEGKADEIVDDLDAGIESNLEAAFAKANVLNVKHRVESQVVTLTGDAATQADRARIEKLAAEVPNVKQVVNEMQVTGVRTPRDREPEGRTPARDR